MLRMGVVTLKEVDMIAFQASRVLENAEVQKYLDFLEEGYQKIVAKRPHEDARYLAKSLRTRDR